MISSWMTMLRLSPTLASVLVTEAGGTDVLKARLPRDPQHPRALLTMLEGLALWSGHPLRVVLSATRTCDGSGWGGLFGDELFPGESQLVRIELAVRSRRVALRGMGDFRALRGQLPTGWWS
jgi:hypothetical protein